MTDRVLAKGNMQKAEYTHHPVGIPAKFVDTAGGARIQFVSFKQSELTSLLKSIILNQKSIVFPTFSIATTLALALYLMRSTLQLGSRQYST